jgi:hypothetical protein
MKSVRPVARDEFLDWPFVQGLQPFSSPCECGRGSCFPSRASGAHGASFGTREEALP